LQAVDFVQKNKEKFRVQLNEKGRKLDNSVAPIPRYRRERSSTQASERLPGLFNAAA
ncbi:hypothetical protein U1Q18_051059, partial [Sarracenia purpurea var. burkii]